MSNTEPEFGCVCGYLPKEDRDCCPIHGIHHQPESHPEPEPQPKRISVGRTQPLYDAAAGSWALDKIEGIAERALMHAEFTVEQRRIIRWAVRTCRELAEPVAFCTDPL